MSRENHKITDKEWDEFLSKKTPIDFKFNKEKGTMEFLYEVEVVQPTHSVRISWP